MLVALLAKSALLRRLQRQLLVGLQLKLPLPQVLLPEQRCGQLEAQQHRQVPLLLLPLQLLGVLNLL